ncbi:hypothetical protein [Streptomyces macrosporus]|uniref:Integral membrane protein n=1 Tax=Streptomyces macrosporus TaxID=44032 RepID=A0ABP5XS06_9ACTN
MRAPVARAAADLRLLRAAVFAAVCVTLSAAGHVFAAGQGLPPWTVGVGFVAVLAVAAPLAGRERSLPGISALLALGQTALHCLFSYGQSTQAAPTGQAPGGSGGRDGLLALAGRLLCDDRAASALTEAEARRIVAAAGLPDTARHTTTAEAASLHGGHVPPGIAGADGPAECLQAAVRTALSLLSGPMLLGHLLAALAMGWLLRRGDAALWRLVRLSAHLGDGFAGVLLVRALRTALRWVRALYRGLLPDGAVPPGTPRADGAPDPVPPHSLVPTHAVVRRGPPPSSHDLALAA